MNGILPLWKPRGMTSHDCVFKLRKLLKTKKVGHTGTLDPEVSGVLPICIGRATKIAEYITASGKTYEGEVTIGYSTTTEDAWGEKVEEKKVDRIIRRKEVEEILQSLTGDIFQTPPMFSAVKVNGKRLYEYARQGIEVERPSRTVHIHKLQLLEEWNELDLDHPSFTFEVVCGKGTYVRTLAVEIGNGLGYPAHMSALTRTQSASFRKEDCFTFEQIQEFVQNEDPQNLLLPLEMGLSHLPKMLISDTLAEKVKNGARLEEPEDWQDGSVVMEHKGKAIAIYQRHPDKPGIIKPVKVLFND
ncbi:MULTISPECIES: tRNA pseudouridine(55) synthase TruB [Rossellomorea]|uniref:tRNA pseudouridine(55) synthase TruB n=1 Tax=Rossellomorea TaxID=2837508 RepID=UPI001CCBF561|nr:MULTISPECIES: tRNA pseudouridine(55) synthase TruB [Rossellomorea]MCA0148591.1 tRNA pseudouridine(55) synthase TruB [Rossellomorea vietnamensis]WGG47557.1 tRNA pseudouridine(55) synthase TruB [Rossellomorea sp. DA94]